MDLINENIWYVAEGENEIVQIPSPWLTMTLQARLAWGASTNCLRPELNWIFKKLLNDNCIHVDPQNFLWVNIEIIDPLVPKDISRRDGLRSLPFSNRWVSYRKWRLREGGGKENQLFIIKCFRGWALVFAGEAGFPALRRLNNTENREQRTADILVLEMLLFKNLRTKSSRNFQKRLLQFFLLKSTNRRNYWDACHVEMGIRSKSSKCRFSIGSAAGQTDGPTGQGPRTVNFSKNLRTSRNFQQLQLFSIKSTTRWNYWDEWHVEMVIRPGSLNFYFSTGSAAGLRDDVCLLYTDYIACFCEVISVRDNVFMMFPWFKYTPELVNKKSIFSSENQHVWPRKSLCTEYLQSDFLSLKTIISSRLPSNKINNYVKNVPIWT